LLPLLSQGKKFKFSIEAVGRRCSLKEQVEIKKQKKNCLDVFGDIEEMIENNKEGIEHRERANLGVLSV
jgi:hypothetical protein